MKVYTREDYLSDCNNSDMLHIKSKERFKQFYEELGNDPIQKRQIVVPDRIEFIVPVGNIIELGCHVGFNLIYWAKQGHAGIGIDIARSLIEEAKYKLSLEEKEVQARVTFLEADILDLDSEMMGKFDTVVLTETLEHVIDPLPILAKAKEFLKSSSKMYVSAPSIRIGTYSHVRGISQEDLTGMANKLNLNIEFVKAELDLTTEAIIALKNQNKK